LEGGGEKGAEVTGGVEDDIDVGLGMMQRLELVLLLD
jgi:hypothetical protein